MWASLVAQMVKDLLAMQETWFDPWVRKIPWRREWQPTPSLEEVVVEVSSLAHLTLQRQVSSSLSCPPQLCVAMSSLKVARYLLQFQASNLPLKGIQEELRGYMGGERVFSLWASVFSFFFFFFRYNFLKKVFSNTPHQCKLAIPSVKFHNILYLSYISNLFKNVHGRKSRNAW